MATSAGRIQNADILEPQRACIRLVMTYEQRKMLGELRHPVALDQTAAEGVLDEEAHHVARREELVSDSQLARISWGRTPASHGAGRGC